jgi:PAS domain S-box-containing protein
MQRGAEEPSWRSVEVEEGTSAAIARGLSEDVASEIDHARFRKAVRDLMSENARLRSVLGHCPKGIAVLDEHGNLRGYNREFVELLGKSPALGEPVFEHFSPTDRELLRTVIQRAGTSRKAAAVVRIEHAAETAREIEFLCATLPSSGDRSIGVVLAGEDRTTAVDDELVRLTLDDANRRDAFALAQFAVRKDAEALRETALSALRAAPSCDAVTQAVAALEAQAAYLSNRVPDRISIRPRGVADIGSAARRAARLSFIGRARRRVAVDVQIDKPLAVQCAEADLVQVLSNILTESVQAIEEADRFGWVTISAEPVDADTVEVSVRDNGKGMAPRALQQCLQPSAQDADGEGLGLVIAKTIVEACGGSIRALSEPDRGTTIVVTLAAAKNDDRG